MTETLKHKTVVLIVGLTVLFQGLDVLTTQVALTGAHTTASEGNPLAAFLIAHGWWTAYTVKLFGGMLIGWGLVKIGKLRLAVLFNLLMLAIVVNNVAHF